MEEMYLEDLFLIFKDYLKDGNFSSFFYVSLCDNIWYYKNKNLIFFQPSINKWREISEKLSKWRKEKYFINYDDSWSEFKDNNYYLYWSKKMMTDPTMCWGYISDAIKSADSYKDFIVLKTSNENLEYINSISRDFKINEIIK